MPCFFEMADELRLELESCVICSDHHSHVVSLYRLRGRLAGAPFFGHAAVASAGCMGHISVG
jgi:hypothetical protein